MAVPKRRHSKTRRDKRRTHWTVSSPSLNDCPHCGTKRRPHHVCPNCGQYSGREIVKPAET